MIQLKSNRHRLLDYLTSIDVSKSSTPTFPAIAELNNGWSKQHKLWSHWSNHLLLTLSHMSSFPLLFPFIATMCSHFTLSFLELTHRLWLLFPRNTYVELTCYLIFDYFNVIFLHVTHHPRLIIWNFIN